MATPREQRAAVKSNSAPREWAGLEALEGRLLLSGNVTAVLRGPTLLITGDVQDNNIAIQQTAGGFVITGAAGTTVNGSADPASITGTARNLYINMGRGGNNTVTVEDSLTLAGKLSYRGGAGSDVFDCSTATVQAVAASGQVVFTTVPGVAANGQIVFAAVPGNEATGDVVFTPVAALTATGQIVFDPTAVPGQAATASIALVANPIEGDTLTVDDGVNAPVTFTFTATPAAATDVQLGDDAAETTTNLVDVINGADLALTAAVTDVDTVGLTADSTGARSAWDVTTTSANIAASFFQGADPNVISGSTVTVNDGVNAPVTFTFTGIAVNPTDVEIGATPADTMANLTTAINGAGLALIAAVSDTTVTVTADAAGARVAWALDVTGTGLSTQNVSQGADAIENVLDGYTVTVNDGVNAAVTFTFRDTPAADTDVQIGDTSDVSMVNLATAINDAGLALTAAAAGSSVGLTADAGGLRPAWALSVDGSGLTAQNVLQGTDITNVLDGYTVTVNDGVNAPVTFTFSDTPTDPTDVQIGATIAESMANLATAINGAGLAATAAASDSSVTVTASTGALRPAWALAVEGDGLSVANVTQGVDAIANVVDGSTVTVNDGVNAPVTFTFTGTPAAATDVQIGATAADSMANLATVINGAGLALTAAATGDTITLTASTAGVRPTFSLAVAGAGLAVQNVTQGATEVLPTINVLGDLNISAGKGANTVRLGSAGGAAGQITVGSKLIVTTGTGADNVSVRNANVSGGPSKINVGTGDGGIELIDDVFGPNLAGKPQKFSLTAGSGADFLTVTGCDFSGFASFNLGGGANTAQIGSTLFESGESITNAVVQFA